LSLRTSAGIAQVRHLSAAFDFSRAALYKAASTIDKAPRRPRKPPRTSISNQRLLAEIENITSEHRALGHRKVWALLRRRKIFVARRRVWRLMHDAELTFEPSTRCYVPQRGTVAVEEPNRRWSTDMTTVWTRKQGWIAVAPVIDNGCRSVLEIGVSKGQDAPAILSPVERALERTFGDARAVPDELELRSDHGSVYTGSDCEQLCKRWRLTQTFAPVGRPTGNAVAERVIQTMKVELLWLQDWEDGDEVRAALEKWRVWYNTERPHESLKWQTPAERRAERLGSKAALELAA
jgi:putative transposase